MAKVEYVDFVGGRPLNESDNKTRLEEIIQLIVSKCNYKDYCVLYEPDYYLPNGELAFVSSCRKGEVKLESGKGTINVIKGTRIFVPKLAYILRAFLDGAASIEELINYKDSIELLAEDEIDESVIGYLEKSIDERALIDAGEDALEWYGHLALEKKRIVGGLYQKDKYNNLDNVRLAYYFLEVRVLYSLDKSDSQNEKDFLSDLLDLLNIYRMKVFTNRFNPQTLLKLYEEAKALAMAMQDNQTRVLKLDRFPPAS